jgi:wyosine [tRNA(Phe)-imidazoG37] synthetase (radical SAM superfamily)
MNALPHAEVFGPVPSRRLGRSLGIDLVPLKTCTYDCIYCQLGRTTLKTVERQAYVSLEKVLAKVAAALKKDASIDFLTLSGSGEPTLHTGIGGLIDRLKREFSIPVAVLTNGSLLFDTQVAEALMRADVVLPTLAAECETTFQCVHRPHPSLHFERVVDGLISFARCYRGQLWLELFLLDGITAIDKTVESMKAIVDAVNPARVQINTVSRPPSEDFACPVPQERLASLAGILGHGAEVISEYRVRSACEGGLGRGTHAAVLALLRRRPCTEQDVADALALHRIEAVKILAHLSTKGLIESRRQDGRVFYSPRQPRT